VWVHIAFSLPDPRISFISVRITWLRDVGTYPCRYSIDWRRYTLLFSLPDSRISFISVRIAWLRDVGTYPRRYPTDWCRYTLLFSLLDSRISVRIAWLRDVGTYPRRYPTDWRRYTLLFSLPDSRIFPLMVASFGIQTVCPNSLSKLYIKVCTYQPLSVHIQWRTPEPRIRSLPTRQNRPQQKPVHLKPGLSSSSLHPVPLLQRRTTIPLLPKRSTKIFPLPVPIPPKTLIRPPCLENQALHCSQVLQQI
jgi:hypothetical protein